MYAIIQTGGKQYRVTEGQTLKVEKLAVETGKSIDFTEVLMVAQGDNVHIGLPFLKEAKVTADVLDEGRGLKIEIVKLKRRKHHLKRLGHRQGFTEIKITGILLGDKKLEAAKIETPVKVKAASKKSVKKPAAKKVKSTAKAEPKQKTTKAVKKTAKKTARKTAKPKE